MQRSTKKLQTSEKTLLGLLGVMYLGASIVPTCAAQKAQARPAPERASVQAKEAATSTKH